MNARQQKSEHNIVKPYIHMGYLGNLIKKSDALRRLPTVKCKLKRSDLKYLLIVETYELTR